MAKTEKYMIEVENLEMDIIAPMEISKKEYKRQLKHLRDTTQETICDTTTLEVPMRVIEKECYIIYEHLFSRGCSITTLSRRVCKEGYIFKNKGEK